VIPCVGEGQDGNATGVDGRKRLSADHNALRQDKSTGTIRPHVIDGVGFFEEPSLGALPPIVGKLNEIRGLLGTCSFEARRHDA
jgi:hypothetical protein